MKAIFLFIFIFASWALADNYYLGLDAYSPGINKTTSSASAKKDSLSPFQYPLHFVYSYELSSDARLLPQLSYTFFPKKSPEGGETESHLMLKMPYQQKIGSSDFEWRAGAVFHQTSIAGKGGTKTLNNGTSTQSFAIPNSTRTSRIIAVEIGAAYEYEKLLSQVNLMMEAPLNSKRRTYALMLSFSYNVGVH